MAENFAILPAGGLGVRLGGETKKQFLFLNGKTLLEHVVERFLETKLFSKIVVCLPGDEMDRFKDHSLFSQILLVEGGKTRGESVRNGFLALSAKSSDIVLIHDVARPLVSAHLISQMVIATQKLGAVILGMPVSDTIKEVMDGKISRTVDRKNLMVAQTPQGFSCGLLQAAYEKVGAIHELPLQEYTDEAMLVETTGETVHIVEGERTNFKVTTEFDLKMAEFMITPPNPLLD